MSIKVMSKVWDSSQQKGSALLMLLALADFANEDGYCWPSIGTLAHKSRMSERETQRIIKKLEQDCEIYVQRNAGRTKSSKYLILLDLSETAICQRLEHYLELSHTEAVKAAEEVTTRRKGVNLSPIKKVTNRAKKVTDSTQKVTNPAEKVTPVSPDPSSEPSLDPPIESPPTPTPVPQAAPESAEAVTGSKTPARSHLLKPITAGQTYFLNAFGKEAFQTPMQQQAIAELEERFGTIKLREAIDWAGTHGWPMGDALVKVSAALPNWGKGKPSPNGAGPPVRDKAAVQAENQAQLERFRQKHGGKDGTP